MNKEKITFVVLGIQAIVLVVLAFQLYSLDKNMEKLGTLGSALTGGAVADLPSAPTAVLQLNTDDVVKGSAKAKVTVIVYSDPSCPFCAAAVGAKEMVSYMKSKTPSWEAPIPGIMKDYVDTGKAKIVFRFFRGRGTGDEAMKIMFCANEQGKFWGLHDLVFENQASIGDVAKIKELAKSVGADVTKIDSCLASKKYDAKLTKDMESGSVAGVRGTPAFFINGELISGAQPYSVFKQAIEQALAKAK